MKLCLSHETNPHLLGFELGKVTRQRGKKEKEGWVQKKEIKKEGTEVGRFFNYKAKSKRYQLQMCLTRLEKAKVHGA